MMWQVRQALNADTAPPVVSTQVLFGGIRQQIDQVTVDCCIRRKHNDAIVKGICQVLWERILFSQRLLKQRRESGTRKNRNLSEVSETSSFEALTGLCFLREELYSLHNNVPRIR